MYDHDVSDGNFRGKRTLEDRKTFLEGVSWITIVGSALGPGKRYTYEFQGGSRRP